MSFADVSRHLRLKFDFSAEPSRVLSGYVALELQVKQQYLPALTPKVCNIMAFWAMFRGFGPLSYILLVSRYVGAYSVFITYVGA